MPLLVAAAALIDADNRVLVAQRPAGKSLAGLWEFPGGKLEPGETPEAALARELEEELAISAQAFSPLGFASHAYPDFHLLMLLYACRSWQGTPLGQQGQPLRWEPLASLHTLPMPPADVPLIEALRRALA